MNSHIIKKRAYYLDILRILACVGVLSFHYWGVFKGLGDACVLIFFVLSGFLGGVTTDREITFQQFYKKKALRLLPILIICIIISILLNFNHFISNIQSHEWWYYLIHMGQFRSMLETYNVSIWFILHYIVCIALLPLLIKSKKIISIFLPAILSCLILFNHDCIANVPFSRSPIYVTFCIFLIGYNFRHIRFNIGVSSITILPILTSVIILSIYLMAFMNEYRGLFVLLLSFVWAGLIQQLSLIKRESGTALNIVTKIAGMTYSIYLLHCPVIFSEYSHYFLPKQYQQEFSIIIVIVISYVLFQFVERPISQRH